MLWCIHLSHLTSSLLVQCRLINIECLVRLNLADRASCVLQRARTARRCCQYGLLYAATLHGIQRCCSVNMYVGSSSGMHASWGQLREFKTDSGLGSSAWQGDVHQWVTLSLLPSVPAGTNSICACQPCNLLFYNAMQTSVAGYNCFLWMMPGQ